MIPARDVYIDKNGNVTADPKQYAIQVAAAGCHLDDRIAQRYGISDALVSTMEPAARRIVMGGRPPKPATKTEPEPKETPIEETPDATAPEPEADTAITEEPATKAEAKKGAKK
jgi:hypothetical protein